MARDKSAHHEKIIAAAREEFMTYGFTDASMRRIAAAAGMSVAGLYKHFTSKEEMFAALVEPACQGLISLYRLEEAEERAALQTQSLGDRWSQGGDAKLAMSFIYDHLDAFRLLICKSRGTRYESFLYDLSAAEEKITLDMMDLLRTCSSPPISTLSSRRSSMISPGNRPCITPIPWTRSLPGAGRRFSVTEPLYFS